MHRFLRQLVVLSVLVAPLAGLAGAAAAAEFGFAKVDVTPTEPVRLSGYSNRETAFEGVDQPLYARAMAFRYDEGTVHVLVAVDSLGIAAPMTRRIHEQLKQRHGISRADFVLCNTHTHTAPYLLECATNLFAKPLSKAERAASARYGDKLVEQIVAVVGQAIDDFEPGRMFFAEGKATFATNRRLIENGRCVGMGPNPKGSVDHALPILKITDESGSVVRGIVFNYACHCVTFANHNRVNGDWAGYAVALTEAAQPGTIALCTVGCGADANCGRTGDTMQALALAEAQGREIADEVGRKVKGEMAEVTSPMQSAFGYAELSFDRPSVEHLREKLNDRASTVRRHASNMLALYQQDGHLPQSYPMPLQVWRFGEQLTMVFLGGEVVSRYALRIKHELPQDRVWVSAYSNDVFGYVATEQMRDEGGYEVDFSMVFYNQPGRWASGTEELIFDRLHELLRAVKEE